MSSLHFALKTWNDGPLILINGDERVYGCINLKNGWFVIHTQHSTYRFTEEDHYVRMEVFQRVMIEDIFT